MANKKGKWTNRIEIVDGFLKLRQLQKARKFARGVLKEPNAELMLTQNEIDYLRLVISLKTLEDFIKKKDDDYDIFINVLNELIEEVTTWNIGGKDMDAEYQVKQTVKETRDISAGTLFDAVKTESESVSSSSSEGNTR